MIWFKFRVRAEGWHLHGAFSTDFFAPPDDSDCASAFRIHLGFATLQLLQIDPNPAPAFVRMDERTDGGSGREQTKRRAGKTKTTIPEANLFLCFL